MLVKTLINLSDLDCIVMPFRHYIKKRLLSIEVSTALFKWFETEANWRFHGVDRFYACYNLNLKNESLPKHLADLVHQYLIDDLRSSIEHIYGVTLKQTVDIAAHKLSPGQQIKIHTDVGTVGQTHRLIIHITENWEPSQGGLLMLFDEEDPSDMKPTFKFYLPENGNCFLFAITNESFHAVSEVVLGNRYSLVYSFYENR